MAADLSEPITAPAEPAVEPASTEVTAAKPARSLGPLRMVWGLAAHYPRQVLTALFALMASSSATIAIPMRFRTIIDQGFGPGAGVRDISGAFGMMLVIVLILGLATATRF
jgi:ATP-binding cassette subfamily B protein